MIHLQTTVGANVRNPRIDLLFDLRGQFPDVTPHDTLG